MKGLLRLGQPFLLNGWVEITLPIHEFAMNSELIARFIYTFRRFEILVCPNSGISLLAPGGAFTPASLFFTFFPLHPNPL
jgi:hypothetical protein